MSGAEGVVHVHVRQRRQPGGEPRVVGLLFRMEPEVLQQRHAAGLQRPHGPSHLRADTLFSLDYRSAQQLLQTTPNGSHALFVHAPAPGASQV